MKTQKTETRTNPTTDRLLEIAWQKHGEAMLDVLGLGDKATVSVSSDNYGALHPLHKQPADVQAIWRKVWAEHKQAIADFAAIREGR